MTHEKNQCLQEPRLVHLEAVLAGIDETLKDVKDLLRSSIQADERIRALQRGVSEQEKRIRSMEVAHASIRWVERVVWVLVAAAVGLYLNKG